MILLSLASVLVLGYIMWDSSRKQQQEQEMLQEISEEQSTADAKQKDLTQLAEGLYINEINQAGWIELYNGLSRDEIPLQDCKIAVNGQVKKEFTKEEVLPAAGYLCVENLGSLAAGDVISVFCRKRYCTAVCWSRIWKVEKATDGSRMAQKAWNG